MELELVRDGVGWRWSWLEMELELVGDGVGWR